MAPRIAIVLISLALAGCTLPGAVSSASPPAVGDRCLVGTWTLVEETNRHGYSFNTVPLPVSGLAGSTLTITSAGEEKEVFDGSQPLVGTLSDGRKLVITIGGSTAFHIRGDGHKYTESGAKTDLPTTATLDGQPASYHSSYSPGTGTYQCSSSSLTLTTSDENQTDEWSKG